MKLVWKILSLALVTALASIGSAQPDPSEPDQFNPPFIAFNSGVLRSLEPIPGVTSTPDVDYFSLRARTGDTFQIGVGDLGYELTDANMSIELYRIELGGSQTLVATNAPGSVDVIHSEPANPFGPNYFRDYVAVVQERVPTVVGGGANYMFAAVKISSASALQGVSVSPTLVTGGSNATGTVTLTGAAPAGGLTVTLTYSGPASGPSSVFVPAGQTSANFTISTTKVKKNTGASVTARMGIDAFTANFTVRK